ncbi:MAG: hypothetical protein ACE5IR_07865, partial [bacterium]
MPKRSEKPIEERDYGHFYFILSGLLALTTFWAIIDMISFRAPWQRYQSEFNNLEYNTVHEQLNQAQQELNQKNGDTLKNLQEQLRETKKNLEGQAYEDLLFDIESADLALEDAMQKYRFAKSEFDALWYEYKHAEHQGKPDKAQAMRPKIDALNKEVEKLKGEWDEAETKKADLETRLARYSAKEDSLRKKIENLKAPIRDIETKLQLIDDRKIKIEQFVLADFVRGNFESFLDQVDRCTSCHVNVDKGGYEEYPLLYQTHPDRDELLKIHPINRFGCVPCHEGQGPALQSP